MLLIILSDSKFTIVTIILHCIYLCIPLPIYTFLTAEVCIQKIFVIKLKKWGVILSTSESRQLEDM